MEAAQAYTNHSQLEYTKFRHALLSIDEYVITLFIIILFALQVKIHIIMIFIFAAVIRAFCGHMNMKAVMDSIQIPRYFGIVL